MSVSLVKGQKVQLKKSDGGALTNIKLGLGWDIARGKSVDLDASVAFFNAAKKHLGDVYFGQKVGANGAIKHSGDNLTGAGAGDDETIEVNLKNIPESITSLVFTVTSYSGQKFSIVENAYVRVLDDSGIEIAKYQLTGKQPVTGMIIAKLYRHDGEWKFAAIGEPADGRTVKDLRTTIGQYL